MIIYESIFKKYGLSKTQQEIIKLVGVRKNVLEVGSSSGYMTNFFLNNGCVVDVVETNKSALTKLPKGVRKILNYSIEDERVEKLLSKDYDYIILADVLEHLVNPQKALKILLHIASNKCSLVISMPNIASWVMRKELFFKGNFEYRMSGLLDKTHLHFYTVNTLPKLLSESGWGVDKISGTMTRFPFEGAISKVPIFGWIFRKTVYARLVEQFKNLSYYHFLVVALKK